MAVAPLTWNLNNNNNNNNLRVSDLIWSDAASTTCGPNEDDSCRHLP